MGPSRRLQLPTDGVDEPVRSRACASMTGFPKDGKREEKDMLILTRRVGETLMIGDSVSVTVLGVKGNQVRIGINAPKELAVHREEIYQRIKREGEGGGTPPAAAGGDGSH